MKLAKDSRSATPSESSRPVDVRRGDVRPATLFSRPKKVAVEGPRHAVDRAALQDILAVPGNPSGPSGDEFRRIKRPIITNAFNRQADGEDHMNMVMITSAMPNAGKTFCTVNLAYSMSMERELNVLVVDADVAKPHISRAFGLAEVPGLIDLLLDDKLPIESTLVRTDLNDIQILPAGQRHPQATELLASDRMSRILDELARRYTDRMILLDSPPLLITSEAQALASQLGQIVLVIEAGHTNQQTVLQAIDVLDHKSAINVILNKSRQSLHGAYGERDSYVYEED
jgi:exopolysaccharide/PEP-CTERM locus tyrosine autokinase